MSARQEFIKTSIKKNIETLKSVNTIFDYKMPRKVFKATLDLQTAIMQDILAECYKLENYSESMELRRQAEDLFYNYKRQL